MIAEAAVFIVLIAFVLAAVYDRTCPYKWHLDVCRDCGVGKDSGYKSCDNVYYNKEGGA